MKRNILNSDVFSQHSFETKAPYEREREREQLKFTAFSVNFSSSFSLRIFSLYGYKIFFLNTSTQRNHVYYR